jgi:hypothetical protein
MRFAAWPVLLVWLPLCATGIAAGVYSAIHTDPVYVITVAVCSWGFGQGVMVLLLLWRERGSR